MADVKRPTYKSEKVSSRADPIKNAISLIGEKRKLAEGKQNSFDIIGKIAGQSNASLGGSTRGWRSVASGFTQGLQNAAELGSIFENEKLYKEHKNVIDSITAINDQTLVDSEKHRRDEKGREAVIPDYWGFESAIERGADEQSRLEMVNRMRLKYQEITGEKMPAFVSGLTNSPRDFVDEEGNIKNLPALIFGKEYSNNRLSSFDPDYQMQLQEKRQQYQEKQALETRKVESLEGVNDARRRKYESDIENAPEIFGARGDRNDIARKNADIKQKAFEAKQGEKYTKQIQGYRHFNIIADGAREIVERNPGVLNSLTSIAWRHSDDPTFLDSQIKKVASTLDPQGADDFTLLAKDIAHMKVERIAGLLKPNQWLDQLTGETLSNEQMTPNSFLAALDDVQKDTQKRLRTAEKQLKLSAPNYSETLEDDEEALEDSTQALDNELRNQQLDSNKVVVKDPKTGDIVEFDLDDPNIDVALKKGGLVIQ